MTFNSNDVQDTLHEWNQDLVNQLELELSTIEKIIIKELHNLEESLSTHPEEDVPSIEPSSVTPPLLRIASRIKSTLQRRNRAEAKLLKEQRELKDQLRDQEAVFREIEMERDVLLQQVHSYLQTNSSLRVRLEEQRCQTGAAQRELNADLKAQIKQLENDKENLNNLIFEKDRVIHEMFMMLDKTEKCLKTKESETLKLKNNENNLISSLKGDLLVALKDKAKVEEKYTSLKEQIGGYFLGKNLERLSLKKNSSLKKSLSLGDVSGTPFNFNGGQELSRRSIGCKVAVADGCKPRTELLSESLLNESLSPSRQRSNPTSPAPDCTNEKKTEHLADHSVHNQLNILKRGLLSVTRKLEVLKFQLVASGAIEEESKPLQNRNLKRKASAPEEAEGGAIAEDPKSGFRNLKSILEDAKSLNAKLQNMREEKQKMIELNKKETGVQVDTKKNDELCQTVDNTDPPFREFQSSLKKLKNSVRECEEMVDGHEMSGEEAFGCLVSALSSCVLSNLKYFDEWRRFGDPWLSDEIDTNWLMDEGSNGSREVTSPGENGGGDNLLKKRISDDGLSCKGLKIQIDRLRYKIEERFERKKLG